MTQTTDSATRRAERLRGKWNDDDARGLSEPELLLYRSNLLGSDLRITNYGGGNTSAKVAMEDPLTRARTDVLWVKGSGGDLGSMKLDGFATLYLDKLQALKTRYRGREHEDEMELIASMRPAEHGQGLALKRVVWTGDRDARREAFEVGSVWLFPSTACGTIGCSLRWHAG